MEGVFCFIRHGCRSRANSRCRTQQKSHATSDRVSHTNSMHLLLSVTCLLHVLAHTMASDREPRRGTRGDRSGENLRRTLNTHRSRGGAFFAPNNSNNNTELPALVALGHPSAQRDVPIASPITREALRTERIAAINRMNTAQTGRG